MQDIPQIDSRISFFHFCSAVYYLRPGGYYTDLVYYGYAPGAEIDYVKILWEKEEVQMLGDSITVAKIEVWAGALQKWYVTQLMLVSLRGSLFSPIS